MDMDMTRLPICLSNSSTLLATVGSTGSVYTRSDLVQLLARLVLGMVRGVKMVLLLLLQAPVLVLMLLPVPGLLEAALLLVLVVTLQAVRDQT